jgi:hypothetical protein
VARLPARSSGKIASVSYGEISTLTGNLASEPINFLWKIFSLGQKFVDGGCSKSAWIGGDSGGIWGDSGGIVCSTDADS